MKRLALFVVVALSGCGMIFPLKAGPSRIDAGFIELPGEGEGEGKGEGELDSAVSDSGGFDLDAEFDLDAGPDSEVDDGICSFGESCEPDGGYTAPSFCDEQGVCHQDGRHCVMGEEEGRWRHGACCTGCWDEQTGRCEFGERNELCGMQGGVCRNCTTPVCVWNPNPVCGAGDWVFWWLYECQVGSCEWSGDTTCCGLVEEGASCGEGGCD